MYYIENICGLNYKSTDKSEYWTEIATIILIAVTYATQLSLIRVLLAKAKSTSSFRNYLLNKNQGVLIYRQGS